MPTTQHPASLSVPQQFAQACAILRNTSRASNPAWYQGALELDWQLHIRPDGTRVLAYFFDRKKGQWTDGPAISDEILQDPSKLETLLNEILRISRSHGATSLGVILHNAEEFATTELKQELDNPAALNELRDMAVHDPAAIVQDSSSLAEQASWRVIPYSAAGSEIIGTTITLSGRHTNLIEALREAGVNANFPIITHVLSAPLVAIMGLSQSLVLTPGKAFVAILQYPWFTVMAFFNEHADLRLIRTLQHHGIHLPVKSRRNAISTSSASLEFIDPDLFICRMGENVDANLERNLKTSFSSSRLEIVKYPPTNGLPDWCMEPVIATNTLSAPQTFQSNTFTILRDEKWALQNFIPTPPEITEIYPSRSELQLLRMLRFSRLILAFLTLLCVAYFGKSIYDLMQRPEWKFDPSQAGVMKGRVNSLAKERETANHWNNLLQDRSKAWVAMEALALMFPNNAGMLVKTYSHSAKPDNKAGQASIGFVKEWKIIGYARDEALEYLNTLNTREGINNHFRKVALATGNTAYDPNLGNRNISVNIRTQENNSYKPVPVDETNNFDESTYPFTFDLTITQRFEASDPMAVQVSAKTN